MYYVGSISFLQLKQQKNVCKTCVLNVYSKK